MGTACPLCVIRLRCLIAYFGLSLHLQSCHATVWVLPLSLEVPSPPRGSPCLWAFVLGLDLWLSFPEEHSELTPSLSGVQAASLHSCLLFLPFLSCYSFYIFCF